jgi:hypothetical protein
MCPVEKATTEGSCQVCFSPQKLPRDVLALHGYQRPGDGSIYGTCPGAAFPPFEQSCELTKWFVEQVLRADLATAERVLASLNARPDTVLYVLTKYDFRVHATVKETVIVKRGDARVGGYGETSIPSYDDVLLGKVRQEEADIRHLNKVVAEYEDRIASWTPKPVLPIKVRVACLHDGDLAFTPYSYDEAYELRMAQYNSDKMPRPMWFEVHCVECGARLKSVREQPQPAVVA